MADRVFEIIAAEEKRQAETLMMIPSENYTYPEVRQAVGSVLMHKYAEGLPHKRYYQGNRYADEIESLCQERALAAFGLKSDEWMVNVQPHSGSEANLAAISALVEPGGKILSMFLPDGGHLSHGWQTEGKKLTLTSKVWEVQFYGVEEKSRIFDYEQIEKQALEFKPKLIISGGTAYPREIDYDRLSQIAKKVGAYYLADIAHEAGLVAGGVCRSPFSAKGGGQAIADAVTLTTHKTLRGPRGALIFAKKSLGERINAAVFPGLQGGPHLNTIAGIAVALEKTKTVEFKQYAKQTVANARYLANYLEKSGLDVVSGGTDKHLIVVDLRKSGVAAWFAALALEQAGIIINRNTVPGEKGTALFPSGIRLGTPALTARGMKEVEMEQIGKWIVAVIEHLGKRRLSPDKETRVATMLAFTKEIEGEGFYSDVARQVRKLCRQFTLPS